MRPLIRLCPTVLIVGLSPVAPAHAEETSNDLVRVLPQLVTAFGPAGAALLMLVLVILYFWRRDARRDTQAMRDAHERRDRREERLTAVSEGVAVSLARLTASLEENARTIAQSQERLGRDLAEALRELRRGN